jgi:peptidoglycan/LPS O-acetylase OafA/YrhL
VENRIGHIDGLRGIAILAVILYHAFSRWAPALPYGDRYAHAFGWGWLGVELFFLISGFVILMTLDKCDGFWRFMAKRWLRLFPAMLICSLLIFITAPLANRPEGLPRWEQLVPGLTFIDAKWWALVHGPDSLEGAFWSLYAEMKFYVVFGSGYFLVGRKLAIAGLVCGFLGFWATGPLGLQGLHYALYLLDVPYWAWFASGALFYAFVKDRRPITLWMALIVGTAAAVAPVPGVGDLPNMTFSPALGLLIVVLFASALVVPLVQEAMSSRVLLFVGAISYPLYLIHESAMVGMIRMLGRTAPGIPGLMMPIAPVALLMLVAWAVATKCEKPLAEALRRRASAFRLGFRPPGPSSV